MKRYIKHWRSFLSFVMAFQFIFATPTHALPVKTVFKPATIRVGVLHIGLVKDVKAFARFQVREYGWSLRQFVCLDELWTKESHWNFKAKNHSSGAFGIPQALPATKMAVSGKDWKTNPMTQINWGVKYIDSRYGNPCSALKHSQRRGWY